MTAFIGRLLATCALTLIGSLAPLADATAASNIIFVNGIGNTVDEAWASADLMASKLRDSTNRPAARKRSFRVALVYNAAGAGGAGPSTTSDNAIQDLRELYLLKTSEEWYASAFPDIEHPHNYKSDLPRSAGSSIAGYASDLAFGATSLEASGEMTDASMLSVKQAIEGLVVRIQNKKPAIVVAHSQGNLIANLAWAHLVSRYGIGARDMVRFVNVANNARFSPSGLDLTHDADGALSALKALGIGLRDWERTTPRCDGACTFELAGPTFGGANDVPDVGHGFEDVYLSDIELPSILKQQGVEYTPGARRFVDRLEDLVYAANQSLEYPLRLRAGDVLSAQFRFNSPFAAPPNTLNTPVETVFPSDPNAPLPFVSYRVELLDGQQLLGQFQDSGNGITSVFYASNHPSASTTPWPVIDFSAIRDRSINGRVRVNILSGTAYFDPRHWRGSLPSFFASAYQCPALPCSATATVAATRSIALNGATIWVP